MDDESLVVHARLRDELSRPIRAAKAAVAETAREVRALGRDASGTSTHIGAVATASGGLRSSLRDLDGHVSGVANRLTNVLGTALRRTSLLLGGLSVVAAGFGLKAAANFEQARVAFGALLGDAKAGEALFLRLRNFANVTPFETADVASAAQTLLRYGVAADKVEGIVKRLGDAAATTMNPAESLGGLALALGQTTSAGVLRGDDARQLQARGVNVYKFFQEQLGLTRAEVLKLGEAGQLSADTLIEGILAGDRALGVIDGSAEKLGKTLGGRLSTLKDTLSVGLADAAKPAVDALSELIGTSDKPGVLMRGLGDLIGKVGPPLFTLVGRIVGLVSSAMPIVAPLLDAIVSGIGQLLDAAAPAFSLLEPVVDELVVALGELVTALVPVMPDLVRGFVAIVGLLPDLVRLLTMLVPLVGPIANIVEALASFGPTRGIMLGVLGALLAYSALAGPTKALWGFAQALRGVAMAQAGVAGAGAAGGPGAAGAAGMGGAGMLGGGLAVGAGAIGAFGSYTDAAKHGASAGNVLGGAASGALIGGGLGSVIPGVGTLFGAGAGALFGGGGALLSGWLGHRSAASAPAAAMPAIDSGVYMQPGAVVINAPGADAQQVAALIPSAIDRYQRDRDERGVRASRG